MAFIGIVSSDIRRSGENVAEVAPVPDLRKEIAAYLGTARGIRCSPSQVLVTAGFAGALGLAIRGLRLDGMGA
jgi:DNA-binding transcriptional MocR family regulator